MKLFICLVTSEEKLRRHFGRAKEGIIPAEALKRGPLADQQPQITIAAWRPEGTFSARDLERYLLHRARGYDACILIVDTAWEHHAAEIRNATFAVTFESAAAGDNPQNFFFGIFARLLRNFAQLVAKFKRGDDSKLLALPLRNFHADELGQIAQLCRNEPLSGTLSNDVESRLARLRARVRPRRRTSFNKHYAVDDATRFFEFGPERHAQFATGTPHQPFCEVAGLFRFGVRLDERRHYNVSETEGDRTTIEGDFRDCHSVERTVKKTTHLNMFANDYF
jgi:hypothetical protein